MRKIQSRFLTGVISLALFCLISAEGARITPKGKILYRVSLINDAAKTVVVKQNGGNLELSLEGFGQPIALKATGGAVETCRTTLEHQSQRATIILSLPIPLPNTPCQMTAGFVSINSEIFKISLTEAEVKKINGGDSQLRKLVEKHFGKI